MPSKPARDPLLNDSGRFRARGTRWQKPLATERSWVMKIIPSPGRSCQSAQQGPAPSGPDFRIQACLTLSSTEPGTFGFIHRRGRSPPAAAGRRRAGRGQPYPKDSAGLTTASSPGGPGAAGLAAGRPGPWTTTDQATLRPRPWAGVRAGEWVLGKHLLDLAPGRLSSRPRKRRGGSWAGASRHPHRAHRDPGRPRPGKRGGSCTKRKPPTTPGRGFRPRAAQVNPNRRP